MNNILITWTPAVNSTEQEVVYRKVGDTTWTTFAFVDGSVSNIEIDNLEDNTTYEIKINSFCAGGFVSSSIATVSTTSKPTITVDNDCGLSTLTADDYTGTLLWSTGETTESIDVTAAGTYTVTQTISGSTSVPASATATPKAVPITPVVNVVNNCDGTSTLSTTASGALLWSTAETTSTIIVNSAGTYTVTVTIDGCTSPVGSGVAAPRTTPIAPTVGVVNNCDGTSTLTASGYTGSLLWSTGATTAVIVVSTAGTYTVTQTVSGCPSLPGSGVAAPRTTPPAPTVNVVNNCDNTSTLTASGYTGSLLWSNSATTNPIIVSTPGAYTVVQTVSGCPSPASTPVTAAPRTTPSAPGVNVVDNCNGTSTLTATGFTGSLLWSTSETTTSIVVSSAGTYTVTQTVSGCTSAPGSGVASPKTTPSAPGVTVVNHCDGTSTLTATGFTGTLLWSTSETTTSIVVSSAGTYTVTQTVSGCVSSPGSGVAAPKTTPLAPGVTVVDHCNGTSTLTATGFTGTLLWSTSETTTSIVVSSAGTYTVTQTVSGCTSAPGSGVAAPKTTPATPIVTVDNFPGYSVLSTTASGTLLWDTLETTSSITVYTAGTHCVTTTVDGCTSAPGCGDATPDPDVCEPPTGVSATLGPDV